MNGDDMKVKMNAERHAKTYCNVQEVIIINGQRVISKKFLRTVIYTNTYLNTIKKFKLIIMFLMEILNSTWTIQR